MAEFSSSEAMLIVKELFGYVSFKGKRGEPFSQFFRGYLTGVFRQISNSSVSVTEVECIAKGNPACKFIVQARGKGTAGLRKVLDL